MVLAWALVKLRLLGLTTKGCAFYPVSFSHLSSTFPIRFHF
jgi:hypothetical protein